MKMKMVEVELTQAQHDELEAASGNPDAMEVILARIADETIAEQERRDAQERKPEKAALLDIVQKIAENLKQELLKDALLSVHYLMHAGRQEEAQMILCPVAAILEGEKIPGEVLKAMLAKLDATNTERAKASCEGCA